MSLVLAKGTVLGLLYFVAGSFGQILALHYGSVRIAWPPTGIALGGLLLLGWRYWPAIFLSDLLLTYFSGFPVSTMCGVTAGNVLEACAGVWLLRGPMKFRNRFDTLGDLIRFTIAGPVLSTTLSPTLGTLSMHFLGNSPWPPLGELWPVWWVGDMLSDLVIVPLVLTWTRLGQLQQLRFRLAEMPLLLGAAALACSVVFSGKFFLTNLSYPYTFPLLPFIIWAALRFEMPGATALTLVTTAVAFWGTLRGHGPFALPDFNDSVFTLQCFVILMGLTSQVLATSISERKSARQALAMSELRFRSLSNDSPSGILLTDLQGNVVYCNPAGRRMLGSADRQSHTDGWLAQPPPDAAAVAEGGGNLLRLVGEADRERIRMTWFAGHFEGSAQAEFAVPQPDGSLRWLLGSMTRWQFGEDTGLVGTLTDITRQRELLEQLRALSVRLELAREEERLRIAREVHDKLGQELTGLCMLYSPIHKMVREILPELAGDAQMVAGLLNSTVEEVRRIATELRPGMLDDLGLAASMEWQLQEFERRSGIATERSGSFEELELGSEQSIAVFRIFQEALNNIARHARATRVQLCVERREGCVELRIHDNGVGIDESRRSRGRSLGILGMRERALLVGADLEIRDHRSLGEEQLAWKPGGAEYASGTVVVLRISLNTQAGSLS